MEAFYRAAIEAQMSWQFKVRECPVSDCGCWFYLSHRKTARIMEKRWVCTQQKGPCWLCLKSTTAAWKPLDSHIYTNVRLCSSCIYLETCGVCVTQNTWLHVIILQMCCVLVANERINRHVRNLLSDRRGPPRVPSWNAQVGTCWGRNPELLYFRTQSSRSETADAEKAWLGKKNVKCHRLEATVKSILTNML